MAALSDDQLNAIMSDIAQRASRHAVRETMLMIGLDVNNPIEMQRDLTAMREIRAIFKDAEFQADLNHLRSWRKTMDSAKSKGLAAGVGFIVIGFISWMALQFGIPLVK